MNAVNGAGMRLLGRLPMVLWLTVMWAVLWGDASPGTLIAGFAVGAGCYVAARLPHLPVRLRFRPLWAVRLAVRILWDLLASSVQMAYFTFDRPHRVRGAIVAVPLRTDSDLLMAMVSGGLSLVTGSQTIELDREGGVIYVHGIPIRGEGDVPRLRRDVRRIEELFVRAFGSTADIADFEATEHAMHAARAAGREER
ncbi:Na+/H+ antiporter subunit E [Nocardiopsis halophila]|uniref:Na+/H+ antiporter subunit E n=1 Tax=Nocardiopsis halophila TaxID=141692 RepID=UPI00034CC05D|nr:Na+/H+ antiporter subunit E [Nocardiopsis halophila]